MRITAANLVRSISQLDKTKTYNYIHRSTKTLIKIIRVEPPEGPIIIKRWNPTKGETPNGADEEYISTNMIWRVANAIQEDFPINIDRILGASYNTRSALESLLAYTPEFHIAYPGRIELIDSSSKIKEGHKHIVWRPNEPHQKEMLHVIDTNMVISEIPTQHAIYESLVVPDIVQNKQENKIDIELERRHAQIQVALILIGLQLGFRSWIAQNDKGISYKEKKLGEIEGVIPSLQKEQLLMAYADAIKAALLIDCIWFKNGKLMPAVMEIEYTTGITSGLTRMLNFCDKVPAYRDTRYVIVAPDEDRSKFLQEATKEQFQKLQSMFFSFSAVEELYSLCQRRKLKGVTEDFLDCFMERVA